ncbi:CBS domain-containing protein [Lutispora thermophila]|uniref:CBS domain-containing protein n=1 Tax=Lutispora thermophila DSM 19022 TaxID=1122184 RepID=A0A1M6GM22_9FIRM|nr:CBS domain-containing protein [Lutispora thermophila]SHJ10926.1 CBS domain-containing protein [Lutispora thermophila DSM 19022]
MNIAFFLVAKSEVIFLSPKNTMRQALEKMQHHGYTAVPLIDNKGRYVGTITEGDLLWKLKNTPGLTFENTDKILLEDVPQRIKNIAVRINAQMEDLLTLASAQNFVPVIDDNGIFIGIIRRREIIEYFAKKYISNSKDNQ